MSVVTPVGDLVNAALWTAGMGGGRWYFSVVWTRFRTGFARGVRGQVWRRVCFDGRDGVDGGSCLMWLRRMVAVIIGVGVQGF